MEMVMKFPNGETPNLLIEVFNYNPVCALQICYTSGFGRHRHGYGFVTKHGPEQSFLLTLACWDHPPLSICCSATQLVSGRKWQWNRWRWFRGGKEGGTQVIIQGLLFQRLPQSPCQRALQQILNSKLLPIAGLECLIGCERLRSQRNRWRQQCERVNADFWTLAPNIWKGVLPMLNPGSMATICLVHLLTLLLAETNTDVLLSHSAEIHWFFQCLWWSQGYFSPVWLKHS